MIDADTLAGLSARLRNSEVQIAEDLYVAAVTDDEYEPVMLFLNHSCEPNVGVAGNIVFVAMRDVGAGEELTVDYAMFDDSDLEMGCRCGRSTCRGVVTGRDWQRPELQERYGEFFSRYLQEKM